MSKPIFLYHLWETRFRQTEIEELRKRLFACPFFDPDIEEALGACGIATGTILDVGTGLGIQAIALAERGYQVTATDISDTAIKIACEEARKKGVDVSFKQDNILTSRLDGKYDVVLDRGCFTLLPPELQKTYPEAVERLVKPGGYLFLKCDGCKESLKDPNYSDDIHHLFGRHFRIRSTKKTGYLFDEGSYADARFFVLEKTG